MQDLIDALEAGGVAVPASCTVSEVVSALVAAEVWSDAEAEAWRARYLPARFAGADVPSTGDPFAALRDLPAEARARLSARLVGTPPLPPRPAAAPSTPPPAVAPASDPPPRSMRPVLLAALLVATAFAAWAISGRVPADPAFLPAPSPGPVVSHDLSTHFDRVRLLPHGGGEGRGAAVVDVNGDGVHDIVLSSTTGTRAFLGPDLVASDLLAGGTTRCTTFQDVDGDGLVDAILVNRLAPPRLVRLPAGTPGDDLPRMAHWNPEAAAWMDIDGDDRPELIFVNGEHGGMRVWTLRDGTLHDATEALRADDAAAEGNGDFMSVADLDGDGSVELLYNLGQGVLLGAREGRLQRVGQAPSYRADNAWKLGTAFGDVDRDGDLDVVVPQPEGVRIFRQEPGLRFVDAGMVGSVAGAVSAVWMDLDLDGWLDLVVSSAGGGPLVLRGGETGFATPALVALPDLDLRHAHGLVPVDWDDDGDEDLVLNSDRGGSLLRNAAVLPAELGLVVASLVDPRVAQRTVRLERADGHAFGARALGGSQNTCARMPRQARWAVPPGTYRIEGGSPAEVVVQAGRRAMVEIR